MDKGKKISKKNFYQKTGKTYETNAITQADSRQDKTKMAMPNDENVERARNWINENKL